MSTDPDLHPIAAEWLDGRASPGSTQVLRELLADPRSMEEFAALARTEAGLRHCARPVAERRTALEKLVSRPGWSRMAAGLRRHRSLAAWGAVAAAACVMLAFVLRPARDEDPQLVADPQKRPPRFETVVPRASTPRTDVSLPLADKGLQKFVGGFYVPPMSLEGGLADAAKQLEQALASKDGRERKPDEPQAVRVEVHHAGDAPVHLKLSVSLPAWTYAEILAVQTGTQAILSGNTIIFREAAAPESLTGTTSMSSVPEVLRRLILPGSSGEADEKDGFKLVLETLCPEQLGCNFDWELNDKGEWTATGSPRHCRTLQTALAGRPYPPVIVASDLKVVSISEAAAAALWPATAFDPGGPTITGIYDKDGFAQLQRALSRQAGVSIASQKVVCLPGPAVSTSTGGLSLTIQGKAMDSGQIAYLGISTLSAPGEPPAHFIPVKVAHGCTACVGPFPGNPKEPNAGWTFLFATAELIEVTGPDAAEELRPPEEEIPFASGVIGKPGMVYSPYAPDKGWIDVTGLNRGTKVKCPYTGNNFRVP